MFLHVAVSDSRLLQHIDTFEDLTRDIGHKRCFQQRMVEFLITAPLMPMFSRVSVTVPITAVDVDVLWSVPDRTVTLRCMIIPQNVDRAFKLCMHIRQARVQESLAPYDPGQCLALKKFRFQGLDFLFNLEASLQKDKSAM